MYKDFKKKENLKASFRDKNRVFQHRVQTRKEDTGYAKCPHWEKHSYKKGEPNWKKYNK